jgi:hypothetical protein
MTATWAHAADARGSEDPPAGTDRLRFRIWLRMPAAASCLFWTLHSIIATRPPVSLTGVLDSLRNKGGSVSVMAAVMFPVLIGMAGLVTEYGNGLLTLRRVQRMADTAAGSGALIYTAQGTTAALNAAVARMASLNGFSSAAVTPQLGTSPTADGNQAVQVTVTSNVTLALSTLIRSGTSLPISAVGYSELQGGTTGCIIALSKTGAGIAINGGTAISAPNCFVASNNTIAATSGTTITTQYAYYDSSTAPNTTTMAAIVAPTGKSVSITQKLTSDPIAGNSEVTTATSRLSTVAAMTSPAAPSVSTGTDLNFGYSPTTMSVGGCTGSLSGSTWTVTCSGTSFTFGNLNVSGGITLKFNVNGAATNTYNFSGAINQSGTAATFPAGNYNIAKGISVSSGGTASFGSGTYKIGAPAACTSSGFSIADQGTTFSIAGPVTLTTSCGIANSGSGTMTIGSGSTNNSYQIGYSTINTVGNVALQNAGSSKITFGDATGTGGLFTANGTIDLAGGSSCTTLPAATQHDVNGAIIAEGGLMLGAGVYTFNSYINFGAAGGGDVTCNSTTVGISGSGVTLVYNNGTGSNATGIGAATGCSGGAGFCVGSGFFHITLTAPTSGSTANLLIVGPTSSSNTAGILFTQAATATDLSGVFYTPYAPLTMSGGASIGGGTGECLELIAASITMTGGTAVASQCPGLGGAAQGGQAILVR